MTDPQTQQQKKIVRALLFVTGLCALIAASICLALPDDVISFTGLDSEIVNILGFALIIIGLGDLVVSLIVFKQRDRK